MTTRPFVAAAARPGDRARFVKHVFQDFEVVIERIDVPTRKLWVLIRPFSNGSDVSLELEFAMAEDALVQLGD
jgi:transcription antitermination factor NusG